MLCSFFCVVEIYIVFAFVERASFDVVRGLLDGEYISHRTILSVLC